MTTKVDQLIEKFKEFKEELNKSVKCEYQNFEKDPARNATIGTSGGENSIYKNVVAPMAMQMTEKQDGCAGGGQDMMAMSDEMSKEGAVNGASTGPTLGSVIGFPGSAPSAPVNKEEVIKFDKNGQWSLDKSAFKTLEHKIERQGHSKESAGAITASIGRKELGQKEMTARSKAGMHKVDPEETVNIAHPKTKAKIMPMAHKPNSE